MTALSPLMGEDGDKKIDPKGGGGRKPHFRRNQKPAQPKREKYEAPTKGLEKYLFTHGTPEDATNFTKVKDALRMYIGGSSLYKHGTEFALKAINNLTEPTFPDPPDPVTPVDPAAPTLIERKSMMVWETAVKQQLQDQQAWRDVRVKMHELFMQHVEPTLLDAMKSDAKWEAIESSFDAIELLKLIRSYAHKHNDVLHGTVLAVDHDLQLYLGYQKDIHTLDDFQKAFKARCDVIDTHGGQAGYNPAVYLKHREAFAAAQNKTLQQLTDAERKKCLQEACEEYKAALFVRLANTKFYGSAKNELDNAHLMQTGEYPVTVEGAVRFLKHYKGNPGTIRNHRNDREIGSGVAFGEVGKSQTVCYGCGKTGHPLKYCNSTSRDKKAEIYKAVADGTYEQGQAHMEQGEDEMNKVMDGVANVMMGLDDASIETAEDAAEEDVFNSFGFLERASRPSATSKRLSCGVWKLFLDSCATNHTMCSTKFLSRLHTTLQYLRQNCNAGSKLTNRRGYWKDIPFWLNDTGIANLLSIPQLEKAGWIIDYHTGGVWTAESPEGMILTFKKDKGLCDGMPYLDLSRPQDYISYKPKENMTFVETVRKNMEGFTKEEVLAATRAREAMAMMAHPPLEKMKHLVSRTNLLGNVPFTADDLTNSNLIFGPDRGAVRGKTTRRKPSRVRPTYVTIPMQLYEKLRDVTLAADVMFVNGLPFFITLSRGIKLITIQFLPSRTINMLSDKLQTILNLYRRGGYLIRTALMDMEFKPLADKMTDVNINTTSAREHVGDVERCIRLIKDRCRSVISDLPYRDFLPDQFVIHLLYFVARMLNAVPNDNGVSSEYSPKEIVTGQKFDFETQCKVKFGAYVEAHPDRDITNDMKLRAEPCIALGPTGNIQGGVNCYSLTTKKILERRSFTRLPMPDQVVRRVVKLGKRAKQLRTDQRLKFLNRHKEEFAWDTDEPDTQDLIQPEPRDTDALPAEIPGVELESDLVNDNDVIQVDLPTERQQAAAALNNANLTPDADPTEIAGVNDTPRDLPEVTDDEDGADDDEDDVEFMGENLNDQEEENVVDLTETQQTTGVLQEVPQEENDSGDEADAESESDSEDEEQEEQVERRYPTRQRRQTTTLDMDPSAKSYSLNVKDGVINLSPAIIEQSSEDLKITSEDLFEPGASERVRVNVPTTAGITQKALTKFCMHGLGLHDKHMPEPKLEEGEKLVNDSVVMHILGVVLAEQYSINKGIRLFGDRARESIKKELRQLHDYVTYIPVRPEDLTPEQKKQALASLIFITEKRCGRVKTRACVNGSTQRDYIPKESTASPTVMNDSVQITSAIDAHEGRAVVSCDIPGAFLHAELDEEVYMLLRGQLADLMVTVDPELYGPYVRKTAKGESIMYVKMKKAMYGLLRSALLFYLRLVKDLQEFGFELNPYDPCVANKVIDGTQMTVAWHVDDLKISHQKRETIEKLLIFLRNKYGDGIVVHDGPIQDYLGVDHDYGEKGVVKMSMIKHISKIFEDFPDEIGKTASSPASDHLFQVRDADECEREKKYLSAEMKKAFHHSVAQLLFVATRVRRDIQTAVAFLTTRVKKPDEDDWGKLKRVLKYLKGTMHMKLKLSVENLGIIRWWVDASYNVHDDCKGQTGAMMSLGKGAPMSFSRKQKLNVRSSTEGELVGIDDALPFILWARYFIEAQGYTVEQNILYQDNKSTILLANNGRWSSSKRTRHIKSRYFFIKDKVEQGEVKVEHRPTNEMWSDTLTKPKQGKGMRVDRAMLMGCEENYDDDKEREDTSPELLPKETAEVTINTLNGHQEVDRRSVLAGDIKKPAVIWNTSSNRVDVNNVKARRRYDELVKARLARQVEARTPVVRGRE